MNTQLRAAVEAGCLDTLEILLLQQDNDFCNQPFTKTVKPKVLTLIDGINTNINARERSTGNTLLHIAVASYFHALKVRKTGLHLGPFCGNPYANQIHHQAEQKHEESNSNNDSDVPNKSNTETIAITAGALQPSQAPRARQQKQKQNHHSTRLAIVQRLAAAGADPELCNLAGLTPLQLLKQLETNQSYFCTLPAALKFSLIATLVAAGERSWDAVPIPCPGLGYAIFPVWDKHPEDFVCLMHRLGKKDKLLVQKILLGLRRVLPGSGNLVVLRMQILSAALAL